MAIEPKTFTAGNNGGAFQNVDWTALIANSQSQPSPLEQIIDTFKNTNGDFNAKVDAAFDNLKKMVPEFVDEFYKKMQGAFDNLNELNPDFVSAEAIRGNIDKIEILEQWIEQEEKEEQDKDVVKSADEVLNQLREEQERAREEAWDNSMHNVAGMDLSGLEIDGIIDTIKNPLRKAEIIAKRAKDKNISPEEAEKQLNMTLAYLDAKKKVDNHTATANDIATVHEVENSPEKSATVRDNVQYVQDNMHGVKNPNDLKASVSITQGNQEAMNNRVTFLSIPTAKSAASEINGNISNLTITSNFNTNAVGIKAENIAEPAKLIPAMEQRQVASIGVSASNAI